MCSQNKKSLTTYSHHTISNDSDCMTPFFFGWKRSLLVRPPPPLHEGGSPVGPDHSLGNLRLAELLSGWQTEQELSRMRLLHGGQARQELSRTRWVHGRQAEHELSQRSFLQGCQTKQELSRTRLYPGRSDLVRTPSDNTFAWRSY